MTVESPDSTPTIVSPSVFASEPSQQRPLVGLGRLAQGSHLAHAEVVVQRHRKRLQEELGQLEVRRRKDAVRQTEQDQHAAVTRRVTQGARDDIAFCADSAQARQTP